MTKAWGANLDDVRQLANFMNNCAEDIAGLSAKIDAMYRSGAWLGPDAQLSKQEWDSHLRAFLRSVADGLLASADTLQKQANQQEDASRAISSDHSGSTFRDSHQESRQGYSQRENDIRRGKYGHDRDMLALSSASYWNEDTGSFGAAPKGWEEVSGDELRELGINPDVLGSYGSPFSARVYRSVEGDYVVAFEGTDADNLVDWGENGLGAAWATSSDGKAIAVAQSVTTALQGSGHSVEFTGHSAGGRQAILAGMATGSRVVTFNTAPVSPLELAFAGAKGPGTGTPEIMNYTTSGDPLAVAREASPPPGATVELELVPDNKGFNKWDPRTFGQALDAAKYPHSVEALERGFDGMVAGKDEYY